MRRRFVWLACLASLGLAVHAAAPLAGPVEAVTFDAPTHSFRSVTGTLGSALLDTALLTGIDYGAVAPGQDYAIAVQGGQLLLVSGLASGPLATTAIPGTLATPGGAVPDGAVWSGDGSAVALYSAKDGWIQRVSGLPGSPVLESAVSASGLAAVAVDHSGQRVFAVLSGAGAYELSDGNLSPVLPLPGAVALTISDARGTLYVLDRSSHQIYELSLADGTSTAWSVSEVIDPVSLIVAQDSAGQGRVYVAGAGEAAALATYGADTRSLSSIVPLGFQPSLLRALGSASFVARDRQIEGEPLWTFAGTETTTAACTPRLRATCRVSRLAIRGGDTVGLAMPLATRTSAGTAVFFIPATPLNIPSTPQNAGGAQ